MASYRNTLFEFEEQEYEVFWTSQFARHVCQNLYAGDGLHTLDHEEIVRALSRYSYAVDLLQGRYVFLSRYAGRIQEIYVHLEQGAGGKPGRCTIRTCYACNKQQYLALFKHDE